MAASESLPVRRLELIEAEETARREKELKEFEEREKAWILSIEEKHKKEEEEEKRERERKLLEEEEAKEVLLENEADDDGDDWEYVEEGPAEIIWKGNEIIVKKKKVRVPKKSADQLNKKEDADRPTSNPLPPQSAAFADHQSASAQQLLENVAQQVPNFGTEQDKAHCPFHLKTGACRFGQHCSRAHFYPDKSCTLLMKNMYSGPGLAWEQDEGLEWLLFLTYYEPEYERFTSMEVHGCALIRLYPIHRTLDFQIIRKLCSDTQCTDEEVDRHFEEFYEDVHTELLKFGEIVNFKVCKNGSSHLRGNVYVHYKSLESAVVAYQSINSRYFGGKQVKCEFVNVTKWKIAICGEYMRSRLKTCSRGTTCNFIHCFHNPGGDYEWADWDKPPPKYWVAKMVALFGYSDEPVHDKLMETEHVRQSRQSEKNMSMGTSRDPSRRSRSRMVEHITPRRYDNEIDVRKSSRNRRHKKDYKKRGDSSEYESGEDNKKYHKNKSRRSSGSSGEGWSSGESLRSKSTKRHQKYAKTDYRENSSKRTCETGYGENLSDRDRDEKRRHGSTEKYSGSYGEHIEESSSGKWEKNGHHRHSKKKSNRQNEDFEYPGNDTNKEYYIDRRKRSIDQDESSDISYDQEKPKKKQKKENSESGQSDDLTYRHSRRRSRSNKDITETECSRNLKSYRDHRSGRCNEEDDPRYNPDEYVDEMNHREPEKTPEKYQKSKRHRKTVDDYESGTPDRYDGRGGSPDRYDGRGEKIEKSARGDLKNDSVKEYNVKGKSSSTGKDSGERYDDNRRSRSSSRSTRERR
ncbi:hypothetical protein ACFE04_022358 [Oxalis oulophora]